MLARRVVVLLRFSASARPLGALLRPSTCIPLPVRLYSTPGRPRKAVGEPSRPVKRGVKRTATTASETTIAAPKKLAPKKAAANKSTPRIQKAPTPEEVAARKEKLAQQKERAAARQEKLAQRKVDKQGKIAARKVREAARKEKLAQQKTKQKEAARKGKEKLTLQKTKQKERLAKQKVKQQVTDQKEKLKALEKQALEPPNVAQANSYTVFFSERGRNLKRSGQSKAQWSEAVREHSKNIAAEWKKLPASEIEHYNHLANTQKDSDLAVYKRWVESHTPEQIQQANAARRLLARKTSARWPSIKDERQVKAPLGAFVHFSLARQRSGDFKNISFAERGKLVGQEWRALNPEEKKKYQQITAQESDRYVSEYKNVYGHLPPMSNGEHQVAAAATA